MVGLVLTRCATVIGLGNPDPEIGTMDYAKLLNVTVALVVHRNGLSFEVTLPADSTLTVVLELPVAEVLN